MLQPKPAGAGERRSATAIMSVRRLEACRLALANSTSGFVACHVSATTQAGAVQCANRHRYQRPTIAQKTNTIEPMKANKLTASTIGASNGRPDGSFLNPICRTPGLFLSLTPVRRNHNGQVDPKPVTTTMPNCSRSQAWPRSGRLKRAIDT